MRPKDWWMAPARSQQVIVPKSAMIYALSLALGSDWVALNKDRLGATVSF
jgi:hypothetical protein